MSTIDQVVSWSASATQVDSTTWRVDISGHVENGYHIYDTREYEFGVNPTYFEFDGVRTVGDLQTLSEVEYHYDDFLECEVGTMSGEVRFSQQIQLDSDSAQMSLGIFWSVCTENNCTPCERTLTLQLGQEAAESACSSNAVLYAGVCAALAAALCAALLILKKKRK